MSLAAQSISVTLGNLLYDTHVASLSVDLGVLPAVNHAHCVFPLDVPVEAAPGDEAALELDIGDGATKILTGQVETVTRLFSGTRVTIADAGAKLAGLRPSATYQSQTLRATITALANEAGVSMGRVALAAPTQFPNYVCHQQRTITEHIKELARIGNGMAVVDEDGKLSILSRTPGPADSALRYGREFLEYEMRDTPVPSSRVLVGNGPAGAAADPNVFRHSTEPLTGGGDDPSPGNLWDPRPALRTGDLVRQANTEINTRRNARTKQLKANCWLVPTLRPGAVLEIQDLPGPLSKGPWLITEVTHSIDMNAGSRTRFSGVYAGGDLAGLLSSAAGLIGGLL